jgi:hypothetical protein
MPFGYQNECFTDLDCSLKVTAAASFSLPLPHTHASCQFTVVLSGGNAETPSSTKTLRIYINDVDLPIANHTFHDMQTEFSISMSSHQLLVGVHAVHSDVFIQDCPRSFFQASMPLLCRFCASSPSRAFCFAVVHSLLSFSEFHSVDRKPCLEAPSRSHSICSHIRLRTSFSAQCIQQQQQQQRRRRRRHHHDCRRHLHSFCCANRRSHVSLVTAAWR